MVEKGRKRSKMAEMASKKGQNQYDICDRMSLTGYSFVFYTVLCKLFVIQTLLFLIYFDEYFLFLIRSCYYILFNKRFFEINAGCYNMLYRKAPLYTINIMIIKVSLVIFSLIKYLHNGKSRSISAFFMVCDCTQL